MNLNFDNWKATARLKDWWPLVKEMFTGINSELVEVNARTKYTKLADTEDIDNIADGHYEFTSGLKNNPFGAQGFLIQKNSYGTCIVQVALNAADGSVAIRTKTNSANASSKWGEWKVISDEDDISDLQKNIDTKLDKTQYASVDNAGAIKLHYGTVNGQKVNRSGIVVGDDGTAYISCKSDGGIARDGDGQLYVKTEVFYGTDKGSDGTVRNVAASTSDIDARTNAYKPIVPSTLDYAVQSTVGEFTSLKTTAKDSLTAAINEVKECTGQKADMETAAGGGFAGGRGSTAGDGAAVGCGAAAVGGFAGGYDAMTGDGVAIGFSARAVDSEGNGIDAIQIGKGANTTPKTLQIYDYTLMNEDGTIPSDRLANYSVTTDKLDGYAVTYNKLADKAVGTSKLEDKAVTNTKLADKTVTAKQIEDKTITTQQLADKCVTSQQMADNAIYEKIIEDGAVSESKLNEDLQTKIDKIDEKSELSVVTALPSSSAVYDFEDGKALFTVPAIATSVKGTSGVYTTMDADEITYQSVKVTDGVTIGTNSNVLSKLDFSSVTQNATDMTIEMDFQYVNNGRFRIAFCDLDVMNAKTGNIRYDYDGIAFDIFSSSGNQFQINGAGSARSSFFAAWLHAKLFIDFQTSKVTYEIVNKSNTSDRLSGTVDFHGECTRVTGIAVYTWNSGDELYFDNINIISRTEPTKNVLYGISNGNGLDVYTYVDGTPMSFGGRIGMADVLPTAAEEYRGRQLILKGGTGDALYVCLKTASGHEWKEL